MPTRPNVLIFVSDSLRADHVSSFGYHRETTPNVDALAADGLRLENTFSQSIWTVPSSVAILTGLYPAVHGATTTYDRVPDNVPRIAERLQNQGYATGAFSAVTQVSKRRNFHPGFDYFDEIFQDHSAHDSDSAKLCTDRPIEWLDSLDDDQPFFSFVWSFGTHEPYEPRAGVFSDESTPIDGSMDELADAGYDQRDAVHDVYDDAIRHSDEQFGRLVDYLKRNDLYEDTIIEFTSDHGEILSDHGRMEHAHPWVQKLGRTLAPNISENFKLFDQYGRVGHLVVLPYDGLIHVPAVIKPAERDWQGSRDQLVQSIDLMPTVADLVGLDFDTQGQSLVPLIEDEKSINEYVYSDTTQSKGIGRFKSVRSRDYKYVREKLDRTSELEHLKPGKTTFSLLRWAVVANELLFDVNEGEREDVKDEFSETFHEFQQAYGEWEATNANAGDEYINERAAVDEAVEEELKNLGYLE
jgi:arylsulfatase A-like enzyme